MRTGGLCSNSRFWDSGSRGLYDGAGGVRVKSSCFGLRYHRRMPRTPVMMERIWPMVTKEKRNPSCGSGSLKNSTKNRKML